MAQTIAEMMVEIGADVTGLNHATREAQRDLRQVGNSISSLAAESGTSTDEMRRQWQNMNEEMRDAVRKNAAAIKPFQDKQRDIQYEFFKTAQSMKEFEGSTEDFMAQLAELGSQQKKVTEEMLANNNLALTGFLQSVATLLSASSQASKITKLYQGMESPLYSVNEAFLTMADRLNGIAQQGQPAVLALSMLGPTANMHQLNSLMMVITAGLMRFQMVAMFALAASAIMFAGLHSAAMDAVPGYKQAMEEMGAAVSQAFQPMVEVFAAVMIKVAQFVTMIANLASKFNEAHPVLAKVIAGFLMLIPLLILILSPMAIGIGLMNGMLAAFSSLWMMIQPLVTGLAAMMGTVLLVAAAIAILGVALWALWTKSETFRNGVIAGWEAIKTAALTIWNYILNTVLIPAWNAVVAFGMQIWGQFQTFWKQNGNMIMGAAKNVWKVISTVIRVAMVVIGAIMKAVWPVVKVLIVSTWNAIKLTIKGAVNIILGIVKFFSALFTGNWKKLWEATKQIFRGVVQFILGFVQLQFVGGILKGVKALAVGMKSGVTTAWNFVKSAFNTGVNTIRSKVTGGFNAIVSFIKGLGTTFFNAGKGLIEMMAKGITAAVGKAISAVKSVAGKVRDFLPFSPAKEGPLSDLDKLDFGGPIQDSIIRGIPKVQSMLGDMIAIPNISESRGTLKNGGDTTINVYSQKAIMDEKELSRTLQRLVVLYG